MKPWYAFAAAGFAFLLLGWGLHAEQGQAEPTPIVPYTLVAIPILLVLGTVLAIKRRCAA